MTNYTLCLKKRATLSFDVAVLCLHQYEFFEQAHSYKIWSQNTDKYRPDYYSHIICVQCGQRWSPRGHGLGLEAPRGQLVMSLALGAKSLALALKAKSLALTLASDVVSLALASENMYLVLIIFALCA